MIPESERVVDKKKYLMIIRDFLLVLHRNICCDPSSELSHRDSSDEGSKIMVSLRNKQNYSELS